MKKFSITLIGGLGVLYRGYLLDKKQETGFSYLKPIKEKYPNSIVKFVIRPSFVEMKEFLEFHPLIDIIETRPWKNPNFYKSNQENTKGFVSLQKYGDNNNLPKKHNTELYLPDSEKQIKPEEEYILIHPFASKKRRVCLSLEDWADLINELSEKTNAKIVVVGKNYTRNTNSKENIEEKIKIKDNKIINLINKTNTRQLFFLSRKAKQIVCTNSSVCCTTCLGDKPTTCVLFNKKQKEKTITEIYNINKNFIFVQNGKNTKETMLESAIKQYKENN